MAQLVEALIAAIYLDQGLEAAREFVVRFIIEPHIGLPAPGENSEPDPSSSAIHSKIPREVCSTDNLSPAGKLIRRG